MSTKNFDSNFDGNKCTCYFLYFSTVISYIVEHVFLTHSIFIFFLFLSPKFKVENSLPYNDHYFE